ncbi:NADP-binding protein [Dacryopinax primogenitus]|uniref:NADP-binding protein n=1 Tax=Dacryopinax primogenitus (strain DJM 731) TaxID=1858805 RepID=M5FYB0_DACPD|nr:NADP-binding protein [Dacryopinax primogenitus]EJT98541.1 NADP-binding protein [Dacryopinax primogenitus]
MSLQCLSHAIPDNIISVTGASSGFGRAMTELLLKRGEVVIATLRKPEALDDLQYGRDRLLVLKLDVSKPADVDAAFSKAKEVFGRIDVVYSNAAFGVLGEFETATRSSEARQMFDVDFWGAADVSRAAIEFFREVNGPSVGGTLLVMSSMAANYGAPALSYYSAAKQALEGAIEGLEKELVPAWNIRVCLIVSGSFKTRGSQNVITLPPHPAYKDSSSMLTRQYVSSAPGADVDSAVQIIYDLVKEPNLPMRFPLGMDGVQSMLGKANALKTDADKYSTWSTSL